MDEKRTCTIDEVYFIRYRTFKSETEKSKYIDLLDSEMKMINTMNLSDAAKDLYKKKYLQ